MAKSTAVSSGQSSAAPFWPMYTHIHPVLVLATYYLLFPGIVKDPVTTLSMALFPLAISQTTYIGLCLTVPTDKNATSKSGQKRKNDDLSKKLVVSSNFPLTMKGPC